MPTRHFNDYAHVVSTGTAAELEQTLEQLEQKTSARVIVVVLRKMESDLPIEEYTARVAKSWGVGEYRLLNSAVLFVFAEPRQAWLQVGTGLESALPDATVDSIVDTTLMPSLRKGDFDNALRASVAAIVHQVETTKLAGAGRKLVQREEARSNAVAAAPPVQAAEVVSTNTQVKVIAPVPDKMLQPPVTVAATNVAAASLAQPAEVVTRTNQTGAAAPVPTGLETKPAPPVAATASNSVGASPSHGEVVPPVVSPARETSLPTVVKSQPAVSAPSATNEIQGGRALPTHRPADVAPAAHRAGSDVSDARKAALAAYDNAVIEKVQQRWNAFVERHGSYQKSGKVTVEFQLLEDGSIQGLKTKDETGDKTLRLYCEKAVRESAPFKPLPAELQKSSDHKPRDVEMTFQY